MSDSMTLGGLTVEPCAPDLFDADAVMAALPASDLPVETHHGRRLAVLAASVALCWPLATRWPGDFRPSPYGASDSPLAWGRQAYSSLRKSGCTELDIINAGKVAIKKIESCRYTSAEVATAVGNSEDPGAASSG